MAKQQQKRTRRIEALETRQAPEPIEIRVMYEAPDGTRDLHAVYRVDTHGVTVGGSTNEQH